MHVSSDFEINPKPRYKHTFKLFLVGLGLGQIKVQKKGAHPARVAEAGQENIETVHEPKPIQAAATPCMDKVAVLWRVSTAHKPG